jgi:hypothetical protein
MILDSFEKEGSCWLTMMAHNQIVEVVSVSTRIHLWIAAEVSPVPINLCVTMKNLKGVEWAQTRDNIA